jgi:SSS family solute:Na+ symporter/sodium/pantothenate symporter
MADSRLQTLAALALLMVISMIIGGIAHKTTQKGGFLSGYFLGNRGLGSWSVALTATVMSGGTFLGFPSLVYKFGWVVILWIASYMVVPLCTFGVLGKRMGQLSRQTGAITLPDLLRERFESPAIGLVASAAMIFVLAVSLIAQFKGGALVLEQVLPALGGGKTLGQSPEFVLGLVIFTGVVVTYTVWGGFLAAVWTDLFQSLLMAVGVLVLLPLALQAAGGLAGGTAAGVRAVGPGFAFAPGGEGREFLPLGLAFSFFSMWSIAGMGQPATLLRLMAFRDTKTLRHAMFLLVVYNALIYVPIVFIFVCARAIFPDLEKSDQVMPALAVKLASPWVAGLILAAPFGAVMATVSAFLVQISSALVQDVYHRFINPQASERTLRILSQTFIIVVGVAAAIVTLRPPEFLQAIVIFTGGANACAFLVPAVMACFWKRATAQGALASMLGGVLTVLVLYAVGWLGQSVPAIGAANPKIGPGGNFLPFYLGGVEPFVWGLLLSAVLGIVVSLRTPPPSQTTLDRCF